MREIYTRWIGESLWSQDRGESLSGTEVGGDLLGAARRGAQTHLSHSPGMPPARHLTSALTHGLPTYYYYSLGGFFVYVYSPFFFFFSFFFWGGGGVLMRRGPFVIESSHLRFFLLWFRFIVSKVDYDVEVVGVLWVVDVRLETSQLCYGGDWGKTQVISCARGYALRRL